MGAWTVLLWGLAVGGIVPALYGLHRLGLWLEKQGLLYYKHKRPSGSPFSCFGTLQEALEPPARHVLVVKDEKRQRGEDEGAGQGDLPASADRPEAPDGATPTSPGPRGG